MTTKEILNLLPYSEPFLFVDEIIEINNEGCQGVYCFHKDLPFYRGHFKEQPITPGVILTECCAQIGLVCLGIYLLHTEGQTLAGNLQVAMSSAEMEYLKPTFPEEKVRVVSEKVYFRFSKLKCKVKMFNSHNEIICQGTISGMLKHEQRG
ncbi:MAG: beta-hydroxyacyl-ACP dehydratase [Flavobacteriaceae bacterium]|nr:beta-hydroxyacyl-ACP dehydratase [Flavobacteriaceae bacterium]